MHSENGVRTAKAQRALNTAGRPVTGLALFGLSAYVLYWTQFAVNTTVYRVSFLAIALALIYVLFPLVRDGKPRAATIEEWCAAGKYGSNYVKLRTPLLNIRITTFVCNETEVKIIDPNKLEVIEAVGCKIREVCI